MKYMLDTDVVIYHLRGKRFLESNYLENDCAISIVTYAELLYGNEKSLYKTETPINRFLETFHCAIEPVDKDVAYTYSKIRAILEKSGTRLPDFDLIIGATAKQKGYTLHTNNKKHFARIPGLKIV